MTLLEILEQVKDKRRAQGRRGRVEEPPKMLVLGFGVPKILF